MLKPPAMFASDLDAPKTRRDALDHGGDLVRREQVGGEDGGVGLRRQFRPRRLQGLCIPTDQRQSRAARGKCLGGRAAEVAGGPGDDHGFACELMHVIDSGCGLEMRHRDACGTPFPGRNVPSPAPWLDLGRILLSSCGRCRLSV